jgi:formylglycine-generating enzyme required for sulfatase activity
MNLPALLLSLVLASAAPRLTYVVAPLTHTKDAKPKNAERATRMLRQALHGLRRVRVAKIPKEHMPAGLCDEPCLKKLLAATGADRAVGGDLYMQPKVYYPGVHWHITLTQVDRSQEGSFGSYEAIYVSSISQKRFLAKAALALRDYDPTARIPPVSPTPPDRPAGVNDQPGMIYVPPGEFIMGADFGEWNDGPRHKVWLDGYHVDRTESSNAEYKECVAAGACRPAHVFRDMPELGRDEFPVVGVDFADATKYCAWRKKRLPTEAEWERAARGLEERRWPWGDEFDPKFANMRHDLDGWPTAAPVNAFPEGRSPIGALNMAGNVWEWTQDWFGGRYYTKSPYKNPKGPRSGPRRIIRGGSWRYDIPFYISSYNRSHSRVGSRFRHLGIRCFKDGATAR